MRKMHINYFFFYIFTILFRSSYDLMWREAMADLNEQLHVEGIDDNEEELGLTKAVSLVYIL